MPNKVLLVGINYSGTSSELQGCIKDVDHMLTFLQENYHVDKWRIMTDTCSGKLKPTKRNILRGLKWLVRNAREGDRLLFHYSGHGSQLKDSDGTESDGMDECLCPLDYNSRGNIKDDEIREILVKKLPKGVKLTCILDACHSGTGMDLKYRYRRPKKMWRAKFQKSCLSSLGKVSKEKQDTLGVVISISGARDDQTAADAYIEEVTQGAMTFSLLKTLNNNNQITYADLIREMNILLKRRGYSQRPQLCYEPRINLYAPCELL